MSPANQQLSLTLRTTSFNNVAAAELLRRVASSFFDSELAREMERAAHQLEIDADSLEVFVAEIREGRLRRSP
ncbi:MAG: hypothetical protein GAK43_01894 [Stenotrophomonas maltophilia]|nr:MAG: hypothetical protein GAK43_01894 [Stenotrophomonas maltophilia]